MAFIVVMVGFVAVGGLTWAWTGQRRRPLAADPSIDWPPGWKDQRLALLYRPGRVVIALLVFGGLIGAGWYAVQPTWRDVYDQYVDKIDAMMRRFDQISQLLPEPGELPVAGTRINLDPPPMYDNARGQVNTEFVSAENLADPLNRGRGDLYLSGDLALYLYWRHSPPYGEDDKASSTMRADIESALDYRYLVVIRSVSQTEYEAFLFDLPETTLLFGLRFSGSDHSVAASQLLQKLRMRTNGTFLER